MNQETDIKRITGSMIASAIGGALASTTGQITDDTQMGLFTAEGLILSKVRTEYQDLEDVCEPVFHSLLRWLTTQQGFMFNQLVDTYGSCNIVDGILMGHNELFALRNPSGTCLEALSRGRMGTLDDPVSESDGPGAMVRSLPIGLAFSDPEKAFEFGCKTAAITHGHLDAVLSSGFFASLISGLVAGQPLPWAVNASMKILKKKDGHAHLATGIESAIQLSRESGHSDAIDKNFNERTAINTICAGLYSAFCHSKALERGLLASVNHSGNIEETGAAAGALLGALNGFDAIPAQLIDMLELKDLILEVTTDLFDHFLKI